MTLLALLGCTDRPPLEVPVDHDSAPVDTNAETAETGRDTGGDSGDSARPRNLVVIHVDTLRADALVRWGGTRDTVPDLDARGGWLSVDETIATAAWTVPSTTSMLTGTDLPEHGLRYFDQDNPPVFQGTTLTSVLNDAGFDTAMFTGTQMLTDPSLGFVGDFQTTELLTQQPDNAAAVVDASIDWLSDRSERPFFLFLQPTDPHSPFLPADGDLGTWCDPEHLPFDPLASAESQDQAIRAALGNAPDNATREAILWQVHAAYDEQVLGLDRSIATLFAALDATGHLDDTLVVFAADHGESIVDGFPDHLGHGTVPRREILRVPLEFWMAGQADQHLDCLASNMDILPTALDILDVPIPPVEGRSLLDGCRDTVFSSVYESTDGVERLTWLSATNHDVQVVLGCEEGPSAAYDLVGDPGAHKAWQVDEVAGAPALMEELEGYRAEVLAVLPGLSCGG